ncbi:MAG: hypothetical protein ACKPE6_08790 [Gammaproteobacteria bacterium]
MSFRESVWIAALLAFGAGCSRPEEAAAPAETGVDLPAVDALFAAWDRPGSPGCALAVSNEGEVVYSD